MKRNKKGFTLVELIVVVAIMAVLAGTVTGVVVSTQNKTKNSQANSSAQEVADQIAFNLNADLQRPIQDFINIETSPFTWQPANTAKGLESGDKEFVKDIIANYSESAIYIDGTIPKAGENMYLLTTDGLAFKLQFKQVGTDAKTVTFTIAIPDDNDHFFVTRSEE